MRKDSHSFVLLNKKKKKTQNLCGLNWKEELWIPYICLFISHTLTLSQNKNKGNEKEKKKNILQTYFLPSDESEGRLKTTPHCFSPISKLYFLCRELKITQTCLCSSSQKKA
jgi:hypothetical protein